MNLIVAATFTMAIVWLLCVRCEPAPELVNNVHRKFRNRPILRRYADDSLFGEDDDLVDIKKRQQFDDYGHMRFGKRARFNDYGHMRFGRSHE